MPSRSKKLKSSVPFNPADVAKASPYVQRLIQDATLRANVQKAVDSTKSAYTRLTNGKAPAKALLEDKKLQRDIRQAYEAARAAQEALVAAPKKRRKGLTFTRKLLLIGIGGGLALAGSEKLRSKVLDALFGAEEEFEYTPPATTTPATPPSEPVSSA